MIKKKCSTKTLGALKHTCRGFELVEFKDRYDVPCSLQASSLAIYNKPGTSAVWLGTNDTPHTRMHLDRKQVAALIGHLQNWLDHDTFVPKKGKRR